MFLYHLDRTNPYEMASYGDRFVVYLQILVRSHEFTQNRQLGVTSQIIQILSGFLMSAVFTNFPKIGLEMTHLTFKYFVI